MEGSQDDDPELPGAADAFTALAVVPDPGGGSEASSDAVALLSASTGTEPHDGVVLANGSSEQEHSTDLATRPDTEAQEIPNYFPGSEPVDLESESKSAIFAKKMADKKARMHAKLQARKEKMREFSDRASGCYQSEAAVDVMVIKWQLRLLVIGILGHLFSCVQPWALATASYVAPYDGATASLEVQLWLWFGDFALSQQETDPLSNVTYTNASSANGTEGNQSVPVMPRATASGPEVRLVGQMVGYGQLVPLGPGMHPGIAKTFKLTGEYQLPEPNSALQSGRFFTFLVFVLGYGALKLLLRQKRVYRESTEHHRYKSHPLLPSAWLVRASRAVLGCVAFSSLAAVFLATAGTVDLRKPSSFSSETPTKPGLQLQLDSCLHWVGPAGLQRIAAGVGQVHHSDMLDV